MQGPMQQRGAASEVNSPNNLNGLLQLKQELMSSISNQDSNINKIMGQMNTSVISKMAELN